MLTIVLPWAAASNAINGPEIAAAAADVRNVRRLLGMMTVPFSRRFEAS
ncbi:hypothetical protein [Bosea sp. CS1GBMeth4]|nr:hypothetical protein [Bosea sp. CS1GBMeth4]